MIKRALRHMSAQFGHKWRANHVLTESPLKFGNMEELCGLQEGGQAFMLEQFQRKLDKNANGLRDGVLLSYDALL